MLSTPAAKQGRSIKVVALSLGNAMAMLGGLALAMVASRVLSKADFATYRQTFLVYDFVAPLLQLGIPATLYYMLPRAGADTKGLLGDVFTILTIAALAFAAFFLLGGATLVADFFGNTALATTLPWLSIYPLLMLPTTVISTILVYGERVRSLAVFNMMVGIVTGALTIGAVLWRPGYAWLAAARICAAAIFMPIAFLLMSALFEGHWRPPRLSGMVDILQLSLPMGLASMLGVLTLQLHSLIVATMTTPEQFAIYANGAIEVPFVGIVVSAIGTVLFAEMSNACAAGVKAEAIALFRQAAAETACILFPVTVFIAIAAGPFIEFLYSEAYADSAIPFTIYLATMPTRIVVYGAALMALRMSHVVLFRSIVDLMINAATCYVFVRAFGYKGAALGLVVTLYFWTVPYNLFKIAKGFETSVRSLLPWTTIFKIIGVSLAATPLEFLALSLTAEYPPFIRLAVSSILYGVVFLPLLVLGAGISLPEPVARVIERVPLLARFANG
ncbi:lipopolysaccharide biosynthesis protein [Methylosinus sp. PW1]|uniref:lipopolysaccharide biosynthesis protein n=1 Tax=Methylosinus sp. PW1 TaxID=107636 RepID=UPI000A030D77|nr:oligosaccharide flippase family protein [Methylosinus sp. PW1]